MRQNPQVDAKGHLTRYDLQLKWAALEGTESYSLTLNKNHLPHSFTLTPDELATALNGEGYYAINDIYDAQTKSFSEHTGAGVYDFNIRYCFNGLCSSPISHSESKTIKPLMPVYFWADDNSLTSLPEGVVQFKFKADKRSKSFRILEQFNRSGIITPLSLNLADSQMSRIEQDDKYTYTYLLTKTVEGVYNYTIQSCDLNCANLFSDGRAQDAPDNTIITINSHAPTGQLDNYVLGSNTLS